jgi:hypothetical protein
MNRTPPHVEWFRDTGERVETADGLIVEVWEFCHEQNEEILSDWARHFRNQYCLDTEIDYYRRGYSLSQSDFLTFIKFPDRRKAPGPSIRAGDFGEILLADYLEYIISLWVPRARFGAKAISNESTKGCDTIGIKVFNEDEESDQDLLAIYEAKARLTDDHVTRGNSLSGIQAAINDSSKDNRRIAESLNYLKQRLHDTQREEKAQLIERFQNPDDHPYIQKFGAAAIISEHCFIGDTITSAVTNQHPNRESLTVIVIRGQHLMDLVHELYRRAADEAGS